MKTSPIKPSLGFDANTCSADNETIYKTILLLVAVTINVFEFFIPRIPIFPWMKPGLANCVTMLWIIRFGGADAVVFTLLRIWIAGFYFGFSFLTFALAASGGIVSTLAMSALWKSLGRKGISGIAGMGITGAVFHNAGQIAAVYLLIARNVFVFYQIPVMLTVSVIFGTLVSLLVVPLSKLMERQPFNNVKITPRPDHFKVLSWNSTISISAFVFSTALVFINDIRILLFAAIFITVAVQTVERGSLKALITPVKSFWMLFAAIAVLHLFFSYGKHIELFPIFTYEGLNTAAIQTIKLWTWLQTAFLLKRFHFDKLFMMALSRVFHKHGPTLSAGIIALEYFPVTVENAGKRASESFRTAFLHPVKWALNAIEGTMKDCVNEINKHRIKA